MTDESKLGRDAARGSRAESLIKDEILKEAFATLEKNYVEAWRSTGIDDTAGREKLFLAVNIIGKVQAHLVTVLNDGKLASAELAKIARTAERPKAWHEVK